MTHLYLDSVEQHSYGHQKGVSRGFWSPLHNITANITPIYCSLGEPVGSGHILHGWVYLASRYLISDTNQPEVATVSAT